MRSLIATLSRFWAGLRKSAGDVYDVFKPRGYVEARLIYAHGPKKGQIAQVIRGRNIVTSWLSGVAPTGGRDMMRRILIPATFGGDSLAGDPNAVVGQMILGSGTTTETAADMWLETELPIGTYPDRQKPVSAVVLDPTDPYVTFVVEWSESQANTTISEVGLLSNRSPNDFLARKTFGAFTKTSDFTLQVRWQIRF